MFGNCKSLLHSCREVWYRTGHLLVQVSRRSGLLWKRIVHKELEIISRKKMLLEFAESSCPIFRATIPLSRCKLKSKGHGKLSIQTRFLVSLNPSLLQPGQRRRQNLNREYLLVQQQPYHYVKEGGLTLSHQNKILPRTIFRRKSSIFFDTIRSYIEKKMEQWNSAR